MSMQITHPQNVFKKWEKVNMSDDLVKQLRFTADDVCWCGTPVCLEAADRIEKLESVTKDDAKWLAAYHKWCEMNGCAPSSSDLISARKALEDSQ